MPRAARTTQRQQPNTGFCMMRANDLPFQSFSADVICRILACLIAAPRLPADAFPPSPFSPQLMRPAPTPSHSVPSFCVFAAMASRRRAIAIPLSPSPYHTAARRWSPRHCRQMARSSEAAARGGGEAVYGSPPRWRLPPPPAPPPRATKYSCHQRQAAAEITKKMRVVCGVQAMTIICCAFAIRRSALAPPRPSDIIVRVSR